MKRLLKTALAWAVIAAPLFATTAHAALGVCDAAPPDNIEVEATAGTLGPTSYNTLKAAFDAINAGTHQGSIAIEVCGNTTEAASAVLNASGAGAAVYTDISVKPVGGVARSVTGALAAPLVDLNGADTVTIDGLNTGGNSLTLSNTSIAATAGTSTIRFIGGASGNTVTRASVLGSSLVPLGTSGGTIVFSTDTVALTGNDNDTISFCDIGPSSAGALPIKAVFGLGTTTTAANHNSGVIIANNNIFDFFGTGAASVSGIHVLGGNDAWTISNNKIYQTGPRTFTATALRYAGITLNTSVGAFTVAGNTIGFGASNGSGTTTISGSTNEFRGIDGVLVNLTTPTTISGNTISGINQTTARASTTTTSSAFIGIMMGSNDGRYNVDGNSIGSLTGSSTVVINHNAVAATAPVYGIYDFSFQANTISNNVLAAITIQGTGTTAGFRGIGYNTGTALNETITNNTIGAPGAGGIVDTLVGGYGMYGIQGQAANAVFTGNTINNMSGNSISAAAPIIVMSGIIVTTSTGVNTISRNTISNLNNVSAGANSGAIYAISAGLPLTANVVERNLIHSLNVVSTNTGYQIAGIVSSTGTATYKNNMIRLGFDSAGNPITTGFLFFGIFDPAGAATAANNFYANSVYIGGSGVAVSTSNSFALYSNVITNVRSFQDNILWNARSNAVAAGAPHFAIRLGTTTTGLTSNFNDLLANGTDGNVGLANAVVYPTLANWQAGTALDATSLSVDPSFVSISDLHLQSTSPVIAMGTTIAGVTDDFDGDARPGANPAIGADEFIPGHITIAPTTFDFGNQAVGSTSAATSITISNTGLGSLNVTAVTAPAAPFAASGGTCAATPFTLAPSASCTLGYTFSPAATGAASQPFTVTANAPGDTGFTLSGTGIPVTHTVTPSVGTPSGSISPSTPQTVNDGATTAFTLTANAGFHINNVTGTCGGTLVGNVYTTAAVTADCTVIANFIANAGGIVCSAPINHAIAANTNGTSANWITGDVTDADIATYNFNAWASGGNLAFFWETSTDNAGVSVTANGVYRVLQGGDTISSSSLFSRSASTANSANWRAAAGVNGYLGFKFNCSSLGVGPPGLCYGYVHLTTTGTTGFPATLVDYCYDSGGAAITIAGGPVTHTVTPSVGTPSGSISPATPQTVNDGATTAFTLTPNAGFHINNVTGTCGGSLAANVYTTAAVTADCTVIANFAADTVTHTVTPSVGTPSGSIAPSTPQTVNDGATTAFTLTANAGFHINNVTGTCGGSLAANVYTTAAVTADCTVIANFASDSGGTFPPDENFDEVTAPALPIGWVSSATDWTTVTDAADTAPNSAFATDLPTISDFTLDSPVFTPAGTTTLTFRHQFNLENTYDGAVVEISINGGPYADVITAGGSFGAGGYIGPISTGFNSPIAGRQAWTGASAGFITSVITLPSAATGQPTKLRFRTADDSSVAPTGGGWWVDSIHLSFATLPSVAKGFAPSSVQIGVDSTLTLTLTNPTVTAATLTANLVDTFPAGLVATAASATTTCTGGAGASNTSGSVTLATGAVIPANGSCTVVVTVHSASAGSYANTIAVGALQTTIGNNDTAANATLTVTTPPHAVVTPNPVALSAPAGGTGSTPLNVANTGGTNLVFAMSEGTTLQAKPSSYKSVSKAADAMRAKYGPASLARNPKAGMAPAMHRPVPVLGALDVSQMADNTPGDEGVSCNSGAATTANSWWRRFYFSEHPGVGASTNVTSVTISSGSTGPSGVPVTINLYTIPHATTIDTIPTASLTLIGTGAGTIDSGLVSVTIPVAGAIGDTSGTDLVVEYHIEAISTGAFFPGANATAETHPTFLSAGDCGITEPTPASAVGPGFPNFHLTMIVNVGGTPPATCANPADIPWLSESPGGGSVAPGANTDVALNADASSLAQGTYTANVCVGSNDPVNPLITVPVTLTVTEAPFVLCPNNAEEIFCDGFDPSGGQAGMYTDRTTFLTHVAAGFFDNPFADAVPGAIPSMSYTNGGWAYTITASTDQLFNDTGLISTNLAADAIVVTFTGDPVTAVGGNFWASDINVAPTGTDITILLSDGTTETFTSTGPTDFRGFTTVAPITTITIDAPDDAGNFWPTMDNLIIGTGN